MYDRAPRAISLSIRSPSNKRFGQNINNFTPILKKKIIEYIKSQGYELGESKIDPSGKTKEIIISPGLCNNHKLRDQFNFLLYTKAGEENNLKVYLAGNFVLMNNKEDERNVRDKVYTISDTYRRLISFYFEKEIMNLLELKQEELSGS
jgi:hypothetical protein